MTHPVNTETHGAILVVTLDRPKANAIDAATSRKMGKVFQDFRDNEDLRVAIITGAGERFFCAGWDLKAAAEGEAPDSDYGVGGFGGLQELPNLNKPVIAAVNGMAVGGGFELALSGDQRRHPGGCGDDQGATPDSLSCGHGYVVDRSLDVGRGGPWLGIG